MIRKLHPEYRKGKIMQAGSLLNRQSYPPAIKFIAQSTAPIFVKNAFIVHSIDRSDGLSIGIKTVYRGASRETQGTPLGAGHENRFVPAEVKIRPPVSRLKGKLINANKKDG